MKKVKFIVIFLGLLLVLASCKRSYDKIDENKGSIKEQDPKDQDVKEDDSTSPGKEVDPIELKLASMSIEEKIGQLIVSGFEGNEINDKIKSLIKDYKVSGFILFSRNIDNIGQTVKLLNDLKYENSNNDHPLFLSIDEEGGRVTRLPDSYKPLPSALEVGSMESTDIAYKLGEILGKRVSSLGFNLDFAPVLDIYSNSKNTVIGDRAFGKTAEEVTRSGIATMKGMRDRGIIPSVKHFPGHGDTSVDSHLNLPRVDKTLEELKSFELKPFKVAIEKDVEMIMVAHILYPQIDREYPSSLSSKWLEGVLRGQLGYQGLIVSDDLTMKAIANDYTVEEAALKFLKAGGDIALICHGEDNTINAIERIKTAVESGELPNEEVDKKVYRVLNLKDRYDLEDRIIEGLDRKSLNRETEEFLGKFK